MPADYAAIEARLMAYAKARKAGQPGPDIHADTAREVFDIPLEVALHPVLRHKAKAINYGVLYGIYPGKGTE